MNSANVLLSACTGIRATYSTLLGVLGLSASTSSSYGVNTFHADAYTCGLLKGLGVRWVRLQPRWKWIEPTKGQFDWESDWWGGAGKIDTWVDNLHKRRFNISFSISEPPDWALQEGSVLPHPEAVAAFCTAIATRYKGKIACYEILSEEPALAPSIADRQAGNYVPVLKAGYEAIKRVDPNAKVACCSMWGPRGESTYLTYLGDLYREGARNYFDIVNVHHYTGNDDNEDPRNALEFGLAHLRQVMAQNNDQEKELWITEYGYAVPWTSQNSGKYTEKEQADYLCETLDICRKSGVVSKAFWYQFRNNDGMALIRTQYTGPEGSDDYRTPAYYAYQRYIRQYPSWTKGNVAELPWRAGTRNFVSNGGFELAADGKADGWQWNVNQSDAYACNGKYSGVVGGLDTGGNQTIQLPSDPTAYLLTGNVFTFDDASAYLRVYFFGQKIVWDSDHILGMATSNTVYKTQGWKKIEMPVQVPVGATQAIVCLQPSDRAKVWFDDISLVEYGKEVRE